VGGKPNNGTSKDKRLAANQPTKTTAAPKKKKKN
jgi:hypothetical protein